MRGRFRFMETRYVDELAIARARNPHYREYPPGIANEPVEKPVLFGMIDFTIYVFALYPIVHADPSLFGLWALTIPFAFLAVVMPVGPVSAAYWRTVRSKQSPKPGANADALVSLRARRQWLQELAMESVKVETELTRELDRAGDLRQAFETQIRQARDTRAQIGKEIARIDTQLSAVESNRS